MGKGKNMTGFIPFAEALRAPDAMPENYYQNDDEAMMNAPPVVANSGPTDSEEEVEAFDNPGLGGYGRFNPLLQPLQNLYKNQESFLLGLFSYLFYTKLWFGLIPFPDPGNYVLSDPIPYEDNFSVGR